MLTVETDPVAVEERLGSGRLACPGCSGVLAGWGRARGRQVRDTEAALWIVPRRARCTSCRATHVLLPLVLLVRRADTADGFLFRSRLSRQRTQTAPDRLVGLDVPVGRVMLSGPISTVHRQDRTFQRAVVGGWWRRRQSADELAG
jgi:hypothetical protein